MPYKDRRRLYQRLAVLAFALAAAPLLAVVLYDSRGEGGVQIATGWMLMVVSVGLLVLVLRDRAIASLGLLVVAVWSLYHGVSGVLYVLFPEGARYREATGAAEWATARATLYAGLGILLLTVAYLWTVRRHTTLTPSPVVAGKIESRFRRVSCVALLAWAFAAILYQSGVDTTLAGSSRAAYWAGAFLNSLYLPLVVLTVLRMVVAVRAGEMRRRRAVMYGCGIALAMVLLITRRQDLMVATLGTIVLAAKWRLGTPSRRAMVAGGGAMLLLFVALAVLRSAVGRESLTRTSIAERAPLVVAGLFSETARTAGLHMAARDAGYRLDGNAFLAGMIQARTQRADGIDLTPFRIVAGLMIPSAVWSAKLSSDVTDRSPKGYFVATRHLGDTDYLVTPLALFYASGGLPFMLALMAVVGVALGQLDRLVTRRASLVTIVVAACAAVALGQAEKDVTVWGLALRSVAILSIALWLLSARFRWYVLRHRRYS